MQKITEQERHAFNAGMAVAYRNAADIFSSLAVQAKSPTLLDRLMKTYDGSLKAAIFEAGGIENIVFLLKKYPSKEKLASLEELIEEVR